MFGIDMTACWSKMDVLHRSLLLLALLLAEWVSPEKRKGQPSLSRVDVLSLLFLCFSAGYPFFLPVFACGFRAYTREAIPPFLESS